MTAIDVATPRGPARVHLHPGQGARAALVLGHGAGGGVAAPDLLAATGAALALGVDVALVEQPYRVAGRRSPPPAAHLDEAWTAVVGHLAARELAGRPLVTGGRSSGARVACRTAAALGAAGVVCLAFPLQPPPRRSTGVAPPSRQAELDAVEVPVLVVQGERDAFGMPGASSGRTVVRVAGDHALKRDPPAVGEAVGTWLATLFGAPDGAVALVP